VGFAARARAGGDDDWRLRWRSRACGHRPAERRRRAGDRRRAAGPRRWASCAIRNDGNRRGTCRLPL